jgi:hypothetical protein
MEPMFQQLIADRTILIEMEKVTVPVEDKKSIFSKLRDVFDAVTLGAYSARKKSDTFVVEIDWAELSKHDANMDESMKNAASAMADIIRAGVPKP